MTTDRVHADGMAYDHLVITASVNPWPTGLHLLVTCSTVNCRYVVLKGYVTTVPRKLTVAGAI